MKLVLNINQKNAEITEMTLKLTIQSFYSNESLVQKSQ